MTILSVLALLGAMTTQEAIVTVLNSPASSGPVRYGEAVALLDAEAKAGRPLQQFVVGVTTTNENLSRAYCDATRPRIRALAEGKDNPLAWYLLAMETNDVAMLRKAVACGSVQALNAYGTMQIETSLNMRTSETNESAAVAQSGYDCFRRAAELGDPNGYVNLGTCYLRGLGCATDLRAAHDCFLAAAKKGQVEAMDYLSAGYQLGHGVERNAERSLYWRMRAKAVRGDTAADEWLKASRLRDE